MSRVRLFLYVINPSMTTYEVSDGKTSTPHKADMSSPTKLPGYVLAVSMDTTKTNKKSNITDIMNSLRGTFSDEDKAMNAILDDIGDDCHTQGSDKRDPMNVNAGNIGDYSIEIQYEKDFAIYFERIAVTKDSEAKKVLAKDKLIYFECEDKSYYFCLVTYLVYASINDYIKLRGVFGADTKKVKAYELYMDKGKFDVGDKAVEITDDWIKAHGNRLLQRIRCPLKKIAEK